MQSRSGSQTRGACSSLVAGVLDTKPTRGRVRGAVPPARKVIRPVPSLRQRRPRQVVGSPTGRHPTGHRVLPRAPEHEMDRTRISLYPFLTGTSDLFADLRRLPASDMSQRDCLLLNSSNASG